MPVLFTRRALCILLQERVTVFSNVSPQTVNRPLIADVCGLDVPLIVNAAEDLVGHLAQELLEEVDCIVVVDVIEQAIASPLFGGQQPSSHPRLTASQRNST